MKLNAELQTDSNSKTIYMIFVRSSKTRDQP